MVFGLSDQDLVPLVDRLWRDFLALTRSGSLWNRRWCFGQHHLQVREMLGYEHPSTEAHTISISAADFKILTPVATSWLSIAVFTDGQ